jgi:hypothetical protein
MVEIVCVWCAEEGSGAFGEVAAVADVQPLDEQVTLLRWTFCLQRVLRSL